MTFKFYCNARRKGGWGGLFRSAEAYKHCLNIMNAFLVKQRMFYNGKHVFPVNGLCLETKQMWPKCGQNLVSHEMLTPVSRSFSQPQIFFHQFCFHEIRFTDKML